MGASSSHEKYNSDMASTGDSSATDAVVIGGSIAGLLSALVLAQRSARVVVLERDELTPHTQVRTGVPQGNHPHVLLARGRHALDELMPGFGDELVDAGAAVFDSGTEMASYGAQGRMRPTSGAPLMIGVTRGLLERHLRQRVVVHPGITVRTGVVADGLCASGSERVGGVRVRTGDHHDELAARLVVDASGRASRTPTWLEELGRRPPMTTVVDPRSWYASRLFTPPVGWQADWRTLFAPPVPPARSGGVLILPVEGGRWFVNLSGRGSAAPPTDEQGFLRHVHDRHLPEATRALDGASPAGPLSGSRATANRWNHYDAIKHPLAGLVVVGDAVAAFNPVYGQGITATAMSALALGEAVDRVGGDLASPALPARAAAGVARSVSTPWMLATGADAQHANTVGARRRRTDRLVTRYLDRLQTVAEDDGVIRDAQVKVYNLLAPPATLFSPSILARTLVPRGRSRTAA